jgi:hypothetical protein
VRIKLGGDHTMLLIKASIEYNGLSHSHLMHHLDNMGYLFGAPYTPWNSF